MTTNTTPITDSGTTSNVPSGHFRATHPDERGATAWRERAR